MTPRFAMLLIGCVLILPGAGVAADEGYFDSNGVKIHYLIEGKGEPVLLIHGFAANIDMQWRMFGTMQTLAKHYRVIAYDNRGHGKSGKPHDPKQYGMEMVEDAVRLLNHLKIKKAHVVGYSMGGMIAGQLLISHPDRLLSATLGGWGGLRKEPASLPLNELARSLEQGKGFGPLINYLTPEGLAKPSPEAIELVSQGLEAINDTKALAAVVRGQHLKITDAQLKANRVPTLVIVGDMDPLGQGADDLKRYMSHVKVVKIRGADHITAFTRPEFLKEVKEFLAKHR